MPFITLDATRIEYDRISANPGSPTFVMLHEGLGSVSTWKDFPTRLAQATSSNVVVYSRYGYGRSTPLRDPRAIRYMHDEALATLPALLDALQIENPILFGHSDGGSIALIHAGAARRKVRGVVALAPHVFVEDLSVSGIAATKTTYDTTNLRSRLARHHDDVDGAFRGWHDTWMDPAFRSWNIEEYLPSIPCSVLAIQGYGDEYGTMEQIDRIARGAPDVRVLKLENCGHSPHRDQPNAVLEAVAEWIGTLPGNATPLDRD